MSFLRKNCLLFCKYAFPTYLVWKFPFIYEMLLMINLKNIFIWQNKMLVLLYQSEAVLVLLIPLSLAKDY